MILKRSLIVVFEVVVDLGYFFSLKVQSLLGFNPFEVLIHQKLLKTISHQF